MKKLVLIFLSIVLFSCKKETISSPNILFIMADDHAVRALSAYDGRLNQTPNIDRIARDGVIFRNSFVTNSICAPSRAVMLTGKFSHVNGHISNSTVFDSTQMTFPKLLQEAGYQTALVGKWHLRSQPMGFDYWAPLVTGTRYYNPVFNDERRTTANRRVYHPGSDRPGPGLAGSTRSGKTLLLAVASRRSSPYLAARY
jgi:arylsulfatase A-like enzyme